MTEVTRCPVCGNNEFTETFNAKDYTVSHETFRVIKCTSCTLLITSPRPESQDLGKYYESTDYLSHVTKATSLFDRIYLTIRSFSVRWKANLVGKLIRKPSLSILDYGCGTGQFLTECQKRKWNVSGVEPADRPRKIASQQLGKDVTTQLTTSVPTYDAITLWHVLEHIPDLNEKVQQIVATLNRDGSIFIAVPNHQSNDGEEYGSEWAGLDVPRHLWHFNQKSMTLLLQKHGLKLDALIPMKLDAFYVSMLTEKNIRKNSRFSWFLYGLVAGLKSNVAARHNAQFSSLTYVARKQ